MTRFVRMFVLFVISLATDFDPAFGFESFNQVSTFHKIRSLLCMFTQWFVPDNEARKQKRPARRPAVFRGTNLKNQASIGERQSSAPEVPATACSQVTLRYGRDTVTSWLKSAWA